MKRFRQNDAKCCRNVATRINSHKENTQQLFIVLKYLSFVLSVLLDTNHFGIFHQLGVLGISTPLEIIKWFTHEEPQRRLASCVHTSK